MGGEFGPIPRRPAHLELSTRGKLHWWAALERDRRAEVVLILPRPGGRLVLITKPDYPGGVYRLPTGGIDPGEFVLAAASREALEESGLAIRPSVSVLTRRFPGATSPPSLRDCAACRLPGRAGANSERFPTRSPSNG